MALTLGSCSDFLDKEPSNELTGTEVFSDWALMEEFHFDTYNFLRHGALRINSSWLDAATDLAETSYGTGGVRTTFNIGNYYGSGGAAELTDTWEHYYRGIRKCNMIIERIEDVPQPIDISEDLYKSRMGNYVAEARFLRAWFYWELFLRYGPVPIVKEVLDPDGDLLTGYTTRPTVKEFVTDFILPELEACEKGEEKTFKKDTVQKTYTVRLLSYDDASGNTYAGRISQPMAGALISRIKLYMASPRFASESGITWVDAWEAADNFIKTYGDKYQLVTATNGGVAAYNNAWMLTPYLDGNTETIFFRNDAAIGWSSISSDTPVGEGGSGGCCPSQNLIDMYDMADGTAPFTEYDATGAPVYTNGKPTINEESGYTDQKMWKDRDPRLAATVLYHGVAWGNGTINVIYGQRDNPVGNANSTPTGYYLRKWIPETILSNEHAGTARRLWKFIGYNEILLNYAEALIEYTDDESMLSYAYDKLDQIRSRAGITGKVADRTDLDTKAKRRAFIHKERTIELAFEEHRWWDVKRWNVAVEALARPIYGIEVANNGTITRKVAQERVFTEKMYLYPIPETEVWKTNIENNSGW